MALRVYLDTTVFSAPEDERAPDRRDRTIEFFARAAEFELSTSELAHREVNRTPNADRRQRILARTAGITVIPIDAEMERLADEYVLAGIIPEVYRDDALHIAAAVISRQDVLASWNFRHMVNRRRRSLVNLLNSSRGLATVEIVTPAEL